MDKRSLLALAFSSNAVRAIAIAAAAGTAGWHAALLSTARHLTPGESIANTWMAQMTTLVKANGEPKSTDEVLKSAQITLLAQTLGMALHHSQITEEQWQYIEPRLQASAHLMSSKEKPQMTALIDCILAARQHGEMNSACIAEASKIPFY
jgi:hypothetical protein